MDTNPLQQLFNEFLTEFNDTEGDFLFYFEMSIETRSALLAIPPLYKQKGVSIYPYKYYGGHYAGLDIHKVIGRLVCNLGSYWQIPIIQADLPKGKVFLRRKWWKGKGNCYPNT